MCVAIEAAQSAGVMLTLQSLVSKNKQAQRGYLGRGVTHFDQMIAPRYANAHLPSLMAELISANCARSAFFIDRAFALAMGAYSGIFRCDKVAAE